MNLSHPKIVMSQLNLGISSEDSSFPSWTAKIFPSPQELKTKQRKLLAFLKEADSPKSKKDLAHALYPKAFDDRSRDPSTRYWDGYKFRCCAEDAARYYTQRVAAIMRTIDQDIRDDLGTLESRLDKLDYLRKAEVVIAVDSGEQQEALHVYHGPDAPQSLDILRDYLQWAETHTAKQQQPQIKAQGLIDASSYQEQITINVDLQTPDDEMDQNLGDDLEEGI